MRSRAVLSALIPLALMATPQHAVIENTGSTNSPGIKLIVDSSGAAEVQPHNAEARKTTVDARLSERLFQDLNAIGPLSALPRPHCMKSVSFGTSLYVEFNGERSPDLNCPVPADSKLAILQRDARELMDAAHATPRIGPRTPIYTVPHK
jgi:hypothetical protein